MQRIIHLIGNPIAGGGAERNIQKAVTLLQRAGHNTVLHLTTRKGDAEHFARDIATLDDNRTQPLIIAAGGDGTINEVANGLAASPVPMAILPFGTTSVLAREIGVPMNNVELAIEYALRGLPRPISLGRLAWPDGKTRFFLLMTGTGFDGTVVHGINPRIKHIAGKGAYALSTIKTVVAWKPSAMPISFTRADGSVATIFGTSAIVSNASRYGGDFVITPGADLSAPTLKLMVDRSECALDFLRLLAAIGTGKKIPGAVYETVTSVRIDGTSLMQIDGDEEGTTPVVIDVVPDGLQLVIKD